MLTKAITIATVLALSLPAKADGACSEQVKACEQALDKAYTALTKEREYSEALEGNNKFLMERLRLANEQLDESEKWYRNPLTVGGISFGIGAIVTAIVLGR